jgi:hypothetical protein
MILQANDGDDDPNNDMVLAQWPEADLARLRDATIRFLNARTTDEGIGAQDREDYARILDALRIYVRDNNIYWAVRRVPPEMRFKGWASPDGQSWTQDAVTQAAGK